MIAYLDPATGGMILQAVAAGVAGVAVATKLYWHRAKRLLGLERDPDENSPTQ